MTLTSIRNSSGLANLSMYCYFSTNEIDDNKTRIVKR